jgi:hypothetical protein
MTSSNPQRNQMIRRAVLQRPDEVVDTSIRLWEQLAEELVSIIGEGGFQSLYARSIHLTNAAFPWLAPEQVSPASNARFASLKISLAGRNVAEASEASIALFTTYIDILALLIGGTLTTGILRSAWGDDSMDSAEKGKQ